MKKNGILFMGAVLLMSSCGTYTGTGAYAGATLGSILGSAVGGLNDGPRGSDVGTIVGMIGGAVIGGAIGNAADQQAEQQARDRYETHQRNSTYNNQGRYENNNSNYENSDNYDSGFDSTNSGDDRLYDFNGSDYTGTYSADRPGTYTPSTTDSYGQNGTYHYDPTLEITNARFVDDNEDNVINRGELCKVIFEVRNRSNRTIYDVQPRVVEANGNKHLYISQGIHVEKIAAGKGIRYTALVKADNRLKDGMAKICISATQGNRAISKVQEFNIPTRR